MRLPVDKIKAAILDPDPELREAAVYYFARSCSPDPLLMPLVIRALEQFGPAAVQESWFIDDLVQTDESVAWLIHTIEQTDPEADEPSDQLFTGCVAALRRADAAALKPHETALQQLQQLDDDSKKVVADRIHLASLPPDALWQELVSFCQQQDQEDETADEEFERGYSITAALASYPDQVAGKTLEILNRDDESGDWLEVMAAQLAGFFHLAGAIPYLIDLLDDPTTWVYEGALGALKRIDPDLVVRTLAPHWATGDVGLRLEVAGLLAEIHTDLSVKTSLELLVHEPDEELRGQLVRAVLLNFSTDGIEPARQHILSTAKSPDVLEVRHDLLVAARLMGVRFPEFDAWTEDSENDVAFRRQWYEDHPVTAADFGLDEDEFDLDDDSDVEGWDDDEGVFEDDFDDEPEETIVRHDERVGRNDPCPCGSGKKYKKCCHGKAVAQPPAVRPAAASPARARKSSPQYPVGTVALYGPDDMTTSKIVAGVIKHDGAEPILERWVGSNIQDSPKVRRQIQTFFDRHKVKSVAALDRNMGCPHEEGSDFPVGEDCPFCPFWAGKQGSNRQGE